MRVIMEHARISALAPVSGRGAHGELRDDDNVAMQAPKGGDMLMKSIAVLSLLVTASGATANDKPTHRFSCTLVRFYVAKYTLPAAETWARSRGATDVDIEAARHCLGSSVQTASFTAVKVNP
jgi:hypothetical protein